MSSAIPIERARSEQREASEHPSSSRVVELVELRARRRLLWLEHLREDAGLLTHDDPRREHEFYAANGSLTESNARVAALEARISDDEEDPIASLARLFALSAGEFDLLLTCLAPALEPRLAELYARLHGHGERRYATEPLAARLFGWGRRSLWAPDGALATWGLVHATDLGPGLPAPLSVDPQLIERLQGRVSLDLELVGCAEILAAQPALASWPLASLHERTRRSLAARQALRLVVTGPRGCGRRSLAAALGERLGAGALAIDTDEIADDTWPETYVRVQRLANIAGLIPIWHGERVDRRWPRRVPAGPLQVIVCEDPKPLQPAHGVVDQIVTMPGLEVDERLELWRRLVPGSAGWPAGALEQLATRHRLCVGDIAEVGRRLPTTAEDAVLMAREQTRDRLGELGRLIDCPFDWSDLVIADDLQASLEDFSFEASERVRFWESPEARRLFPRGTGLVGLLAGPPGTGKTMATQVIAAELELDLFRINLATVISKYIGETAKNLDRIFSRAARMNAVLLFDEADALFSKRTEVRDSHDRYANSDTNYLLQLLEEYRGIALLASNKKSNIDPAFIRRIRYVFDFRRPDVGQRRTIWRRVLRELVGAEVLRELEPAVAVLAEAVEISGAQIKNAVLAAVFVARRRRRRLGIDDLMRGIDRELGKEGRGLSDRERERLRRNV